MRPQITISRGTNDKPVASQALAHAIAEYDGCTGQLMIGYPIIATGEGPHPIDALLFSREKGILVLDLVEGTTPGDFGTRQDDSANKLEARLKTHLELLERRELRVPVSTVTFAPGLTDVTRFSDFVDYPIVCTPRLLPLQPL